MGKRIALHFYQCAISAPRQCSPSEILSHLLVIERFIPSCPAELTTLLLHCLFSPLLYCTHKSDLLIEKAQRSQTFGEEKKHHWLALYQIPALHIHCLSEVNAKWKCLKEQHRHNIAGHTHTYTLVQLPQNVKLSDHSLTNFIRWMCSE